MIILEKFTKLTNGNTDIVNITDDVAGIVSSSNIEKGIAAIFVCGSTAGITTIEYEKGLIYDMKEALNRIAPVDAYYEHNARWGDGNGYSHIRASLIGPSLSVPFTDKRLMLGTWQQIILLDFDNRPRQREVSVQVAGE